MFNVSCNEIVNTQLYAPFEIYKILHYKLLFFLLVVDFLTCMSEFMKIRKKILNTLLKFFVILLILLYIVEQFRADGSAHREDLEYEYIFI